MTERTVEAHVKQIFMSWAGASSEFGTIVAVKPRETFLRYFQTADEPAQRREKTRGVKSGSDGASARERHRIEIRC